MTRINCIDPALLRREHLLAEYRELPRIFGLVRRAVERGERPDDPRNPAEYVLGAGHVRFFYPRLGYLHDRFRRIVDECVARGYDVQFRNVDALCEGIPEEWFGNWMPDDAAVRRNIERLRERGGGRQIGE